MHVHNFFLDQPTYNACAIIYKASCVLGTQVISPSASIPDPVRKVPAAHKLQLTLPEAPVRASPFRPHHIARYVTNQSRGEEADLTPSRKSQPDTSCM